MKLSRAILILILSAVIQISFIRVFYLFPLPLNLLLVALFLFSYFLSFDDLLVLTIFGGLMLDFSSAVSFGSSSVAALLAFLLGFFLKEKILKGKRIVEFFLNGLIVFFVFYLFLEVASAFLKSALSFAAVFGAINSDLLLEILFNTAVSASAYYIIKNYKNGKFYGTYWNIKKTGKIPS